MGVEPNKPNTLKVNAKKKTSKENLSMAMYALVYKSMQNKSIKKIEAQN